MVRIVCAGNQLDTAVMSTNNEHENTSAAVEHTTSPIKKTLSESTCAFQHAEHFITFGMTSASNIRRLKIMANSGTTGAGKSHSAINDVTFEFN